MTQYTPEKLLALLCKTTAQTPMTDIQIAAAWNIDRDQANQLLDLLYEGKAISSVKNIKGGIEQRLVWATGLPYRPALYVPKQATWGHLRNETPMKLLSQPEQEAIMDDAKPSVQVKPPNTDNKELIMLQCIYQAQGKPVTGGELRAAANAGTVDAYIEWYLKNAFICKTEKTPGNPITYYLVPNDYPTADKLYEFKKSIVYKNRNQKDLPAADKFTSIVDDGRRYKLLDIEQESPPTADETVAENTATVETKTSSVHQFIEEIFRVTETEPEPQPINSRIEQQQHIRFALTDEGTLMILGVQYAPIELSKEDTKRLYDFAENTAHAI